MIFRLLVNVRVCDCLASLVQYSRSYRLQCSRNVHINPARSTAAAAAFRNVAAATHSIYDQVLNRVAVKFPPSWTDQTQIWLAQVEAKFFTAGITTAELKLNTVVAAIVSNILVQISNVVLSPPVHEKYVFF